MSGRRCRAGGSEVGGKQCSKCGAEKPLDAFSIDRNTRSGRSCRCRACQRLWRVHWPRPGRKRGQPSPAALDAKRARDRRRRFIPAERHKTRISGWRRRGITLTVTEYEGLFAAQDGRCAICACILKPWGRPLEGGACVDHEKGTGRVRGLLCSRCNLGLGSFNDGNNILDSAEQRVPR